MTTKTKKPLLDPLISFATQLWAIAGDALDILAAALLSGDFSLDSRDPESIDVTVVDGIAVIAISGGLGKDHGWQGYFREYSGYLGIREKVEKALLMPNAKAILFKVDSPGGSVGGCKECADFLRVAATKKPMYTYVDGTMCSAAYWLGSVGKVIAAPETAQIGSIGVRALHADWSEYDKKTGIKYTHITAGKYKAIPNMEEPLTREGLDYIQERLDLTYGIFVDAVAKNRGMDKKAITDLEAKVLLAGPAVESGLIDRIESDINTFISFIQSEEESLMDYTTLKANHSDLFEKIKAEGAAAEKLKNDAAMKENIKSAVDSALGVVSAVAGDDIGGKVKTLVESDITAAQVTAMKDMLGLQASPTPPAPAADAQAGKDAILNALNAATPPPAGGGGHQVDADALDFDALVDAHMESKGCTKGAAMSAMSAKYPDSHEKWLKAQQRN